MTSKKNKKLKIFKMLMNNIKERADYQNFNKYNFYKIIVNNKKNINLI